MYTKDLEIQLLNTAYTGTKFVQKKKLKIDYTYQLYKLRPSRIYR